MKQQTLAMASGFERYGKKTRRTLFLEEMEQVVPWSELCGLIEPVYAKAGNGRPPVGAERMLRIYFLQQWFNLSDPGVEEALYDSAGMRQFVALIWGGSRCRTKPRCASSAICWNSTVWESGCRASRRIPEKKQKGRRNWAGKPAEQQAVYANRRRVRGDYGKRLLRRRGEFVERSFAHCYETGAMRRCHLRGRDNILKRQLVHVGAFNLSLILRQLLGAGTPRELRNRFARLVVSVLLLFSNRNSQQRLRCRRIFGSVAKCVARSRTRLRYPLCRKSATCTTDC